MTTQVTDTARIVDEVCQMHGDRQATVVVEGDDFEACGGNMVKTAVLQKAVKLGISRAGISDPGQPYRVDEAGNPVNPLQPNSPGAKFRRDYKVTAGL